MRRAAAIWAGLTAVGVMLAGCTAAGPSPTGTPAPSTAPAAASSCVPDPDAVIARTGDLPTSYMSAELAAVIDEAAQEGFAQAAAPGAIVAVQSPEGLFLQAYGVADPASGAPMTTDMHQRAGSVNKTLTTTVVLQLAAEGALSLDDPVSEYLPDVPNGDAITLRMLSSMTSGLASYTKDPDFQAQLFGEPERVWAPDELVEYGLALPPEFEPGASFDYSNTNTVLLGKVIETVTGDTVDEAFADRIFGPLGLADSSFPGTSAVLPDPHARGFTLQGDTATPEAPADATDWNPSWGWVAGELISTASDLLVYARDQATGAGLVPADLQRDRLTSFSDYSGYGLGMVCSNGWVGHTGELPGFNTGMFYDTTTDTTVITMTNSDIASGDCPEGATLVDDPGGAPCSSPAVRILVAISTALGHPYAPPGS